MSAGTDISIFTAQKTWPLAAAVVRIIRDGGMRAYVVGGWVRDSLLGLQAGDIDFAVQGGGADTARRVAAALSGKVVALDDSNRVVRVVLPDSGISGAPSGRLDFSTFEDKLEADLGRRDFTIDAMALDIGDGSSVMLVDPLNGKGDLAGGVVRAVRDDVFSADPARLLRAARLAATLGFRIEAGTEALIRRDCRLVSGVAGERIREELLLLLAAPRCGMYLASLDSLGLLCEIFPELKAAKGWRQPAEHHWDVLAHSIKTVEALEFVLRDGPWGYGGEEGPAPAPWSPELADYFDQEVGYGSSRRSLLKLAALLHDVSKPETMSVEESGKTRYLGHGRVGAAVSAGIMARLRFSTREIRFVEASVRHHLRPTQLGWPEMPTRRAVYRYLRDAGDAAVGILFLSLADHLATRGPAFDAANWQIHTGIVAHVLSQKPEESKRRRALIDGYDIMRIFGLRPGHRVGELLEALREAEAAGEIGTREEALNLVRRLIASAPGGTEAEGEDN